MQKILSVVILATLAYTNAADAEVTHCDPFYQGKPFVQATIWSGPNGFGQAECDYKDPDDKKVITYHFPNENQYYPVSGRWKSTMPGYQWCSINDGNQFDTCKFAKRET